jgi:hypothetical protein
MIKVIWVLIVVMSGGGVAESVEVGFQEFNSKFDCEAASIEVMKMAAEIRMRKVQTSCVEKGREIFMD